MPSRRHSRQPDRRTTPKTGLELEELQFGFPPVTPLPGDDDDVCEDLSHTIIIKELKELGFRGAAAFVARFPLELIAHVLDQVAPMERYASSNALRRRRPRTGVRNAPALIRWLVEQEVDS